MSEVRAGAVTGGAGSRNRRWVAAAVAGAGVGVLGGMIGLGGAEFRLPLLIGMFGFLALQAVIVNKALSLLVVATALPARLVAVPLTELTPHWTIVVDLLAGSLLGAYLGATWATRMATRTLYRVLALLLVLIAVALLITIWATSNPLTSPDRPKPSPGCSPVPGSGPSPR